MKISNAYVEIEIPDNDESEVKMMTLRFPLTKAEITITRRESEELWLGLETIYGDSDQGEKDVC